MFRRLILQSGSALSAPWAVIPDPLDQTRRLGAILNCSRPGDGRGGAGGGDGRDREGRGGDGGSAGLVQCLKRLPYETLAGAVVPMGASYMPVCQNWSNCSRN